MCCFVYVYVDFDEKNDLRKKHKYEVEVQLVQSLIEILKNSARSFDISEHKQQDKEDKWTTVINQTVVKLLFNNV